MTITLSGLGRFPVKSCRGERLEEAVVEPWGLAGDRRWMVVDGAGEAITAREVNALVLVRAEVTAGGLRLHAQGAGSIDVAVPDASVQVPVRLWGSAITAAPTGREVAAWISEVVEQDARLVWLDDPTRRTTDPRFGGPDDVVSFADGYPMLVASESSLAALEVDGLEMDRFRPNLVVAGAEPWAEDDWRRVRVGEVTFRAVKGCARCVMTTVDPLTAERGKQPIQALARSRRWDRQTWFGVNLVPEVDPGSEGERPRIAVGDEVEVLESVAPGGGPIR